MLAVVTVAPLTQAAVAAAAATLMLTQPLLLLLLLAVGRALPGALREPRPTPLRWHRLFYTPHGAPASLRAAAAPPHRWLLPQALLHQVPQGELAA
jgi:hypothetical protein